MSWARRAHYPPSFSGRLVYLVRFGQKSILARDERPSSSASADNAPARSKAGDIHRGTSRRAPASNKRQAPIKGGRLWHCIMIPAGPLSGALTAGSWSVSLSGVCLLDAVGLVRTFDFLTADPLAR
jgi:hypothetical protein